MERRQLKVRVIDLNDFFSNTCPRVFIPYVYFSCSTVSIKAWEIMITGSNGDKETCVFVNGTKHGPATYYWKAGHR